MLPEWNHMPEHLQLALSREALYRAAGVMAAQAETLAGEIEHGSLADRGGPEALRLFAAIVRGGNRDELAPAGHG